MKKMNRTKILLVFVCLLFHDIAYSQDSIVLGFGLPVNSVLSMIQGYGYADEYNFNVEFQLNENEVINYSIRIDDLRHSFWTTWMQRWYSVETNSLRFSTLINLTLSMEEIIGITISAGPSIYWDCKRTQAEESINPNGDYSEYNTYGIDLFCRANVFFNVSSSLKIGMEIFGDSLYEYNITNNEFSDWEGLVGKWFNPNVSVFLGYRF